MATEAFRSAADTSDRTVDRLSSRAHDAVDQVASTVNSATDRLAAKGDEFARMADDSLAGVRDYAREQPVMALGIAFAIGCVVGRLMR